MNIEQEICFLAQITQKKFLHLSMTHAWARTIISLCNQKNVVNCYGCKVGNLSQSSHECLISSTEENLNIYYSEVLSTITKSMILSDFYNILKYFEFNGDVINDFIENYEWEWMKDQNEDTKMYMEIYNHCKNCICTFYKNG